MVIKDSLKVLVELQGIDSKIYKAKVTLEDFPAELEEIEREYAQAEESLKEFTDAVTASEISKKDKETALKGNEDKIAKYEGQLLQIKTNKEYTALQNEINGIKADNSVLEEEILMLMDEVDEKKRELEAQKAKLAEVRAHSDERKAQISKIVDEKKSEITALESERKGIAEQADPTLLAQYERILKNKKGLAIAAIEGNACGGCHMNVPPQIVNEAKNHDRLISCEMCGRILYSFDQDG